MSAETAGWLCEKIDDFGSLPRYVTVTPLGIELTTSNHDALRFARQCDAQAFIPLCPNWLLEAREHMWMDR